MFKSNSWLVLGLVLTGWGAWAGPTNSPSKPAPSLGALLGPDFPSGARAKGAWQEQRARLERQWLQALGPLPKSKPALKTEMLESEETPQFKRQHMRYQVEAGLYTDGYLLTPKNAQTKLPAVVVFHPTTPFGPRGVAGLEPSYPQDKWQGVQLVQCGYIVWCPRNYINSEGADYAGNAAGLRLKHPEWNGMTRMTWDAMRAADFLCSWPGVDTNRIACLGHSLGAKVVLYAMALDERYCAGVASEGGIGLSFSNWDAPWYWGAKVHQAGFGLEHHQLVALMAPRPFLLIAGDSADDLRSQAFIQAAEPVYQLFGAAPKLQFFDHHGGHVYGPQVRAVAEAFLQSQLRPGH